MTPASNTITGTAAGDNIQGDDGADRLTGAGGFDTLVGGAGGDTFDFNSPSEGMDAIIDFVSGLDTLEFSVLGFGGGLTAGMDPATVFGSSNDAAFGSAAERFHFDAVTNTLYFDADGNGSSSTAVAVAQFLNNVTLHANDLLIV